MERREEVRNGSRVSNLAVVVPFIKSGNGLLKLAGKGNSWVTAWKIPMIWVRRCLAGGSAIPTGLQERRVPSRTHMHAPWDTAWPLVYFCTTRMHTSFHMHAFTRTYGTPPKALARTPATCYTQSRERPLRGQQDMIFWISKGNPSPSPSLPIPEEDRERGVSRQP